METGFSKFFRSSLTDAEIILRAGQRIISEINILVENSQGSSQIPKSNQQLLNAEIKKQIARHEDIKKSSLTDAEIILRAGQRIISEINILVENSQGSSQIPKSNQQLLNAEIKKQIARHEDIKSMSFTRNGRIRLSMLDPVCAAQILSLEKISNVSVKTNILWEGTTSRFLIFEIPLDISLNEIEKELQETNNFEIIEMRRFIKTGSQQQFSPVLITILGTTLSETDCETVVHQSSNSKFYR
ncbi:uncharacterized protein TNCV_1369181 [Trichonephila clavipes]|nr:uncharacterized protein TNCV_1369181 [Trichonephila clavipes]